MRLPRGDGTARTMTSERTKTKTKTIFSASGQSGSFFSFLAAPCRDARRAFPRTRGVPQPFGPRRWHSSTRPRARRPGGSRAAARSASAWRPGRRRAVASFVSSRSHWRPPRQISAVDHTGDRKPLRSPGRRERRREAFPRSHAAERLIMVAIMSATKHAFSTQGMFRRRFRSRPDGGERGMPTNGAPPDGCVDFVPVRRGSPRRGRVRASPGAPPRALCRWCPRPRKDAGGDPGRSGYSPAAGGGRRKYLPAFFRRFSR